MHIALYHYNKTKNGMDIRDDNQEVLVTRYGKYKKLAHKMVRKPVKSEKDTKEREDLNVDMDEDGFAPVKRGNRRR